MNTSFPTSNSSNQKYMSEAQRKGLINHLEQAIFIEKDRCDPSDISSQRLRLLKNYLSNLKQYDEKASRYSTLNPSYSSSSSSSSSYLYFPKNTCTYYPPSSFSSPLPSTNTTTNILNMNSRKSSQKRYTPLSHNRRYTPVFLRKKKIPATTTNTPLCKEKVNSESILPPPAPSPPKEELEVNIQPEENVPDDDTVTNTTVREEVAIHKYMEETGCDEKEARKIQNGPKKIEQCDPHGILYHLFQRIKRSVYGAITTTELFQSPSSSSSSKR